MRRGLCAILLLGLSAVCFAKGNMELYGGMPLMWEEETVLGYEAETLMTSYAFGFGAVSPINNVVSLGVYDELIFPQKFEVTVDGEFSDPSSGKSLCGK
jgi:hypothetical protein